MTMQYVIRMHTRKYPCWFIFACVSMQKKEIILEDLEMVTIDDVMQKLSIPAVTTRRNLGCSFVCLLQDSIFVTSMNLYKHNHAVNTPMLHLIWKEGKWAII